MGKARAPHNAARPESQAVVKALEADDMDALYYALSFRQRAFCKEYVVDFIGGAAAVRAGYSTKWPDQQAAQLLRNQGIARYIEYLTESKESKIMSVNPDYVIQQVTSIIHKDGAKDGDKLRALELLARHLGMFIDRTEITGKDGAAIAVEQRKIEEEAQSFTDLMKQLQERHEADKDRLAN